LQSEDDGRASATVRFDTKNTQQIAITIEPAGGSEEPTTPALYVADL
jgi:anti-sigma-K factor RskA